MLKRAAFLITFVFLFTASVLSEESLTITTYYPSPNGSYRQMTANQIVVGTGYRNPVYSDGTLYVENNAGIGTNNVSSGLRLDVEGNLGAVKYCDQNGGNCRSANEKIFTMCSHGSAEKACVEAAKNGGKGTDKYRVISCVTRDNAAIVTAELVNVSGRWRYTISSGSNECMDNSILVANLEY